MRREQFDITGLCLAQVALIAAITSFVANIDAIAISVNASHSVIAVAGSAYGIAFGGLAICAPMVRAKMGTRSTIFAAMGLWLLSSICLVAWPSSVAILISRCVQGAAAAILAPCLIVEVRTILGERFAPFLRIWGVVSPLGALLGVMVGLLSVWLGDWRISPPLLTILMLASLSILWSTSRPTTRADVVVSLHLYGWLFPLFVILMYSAISLYAWGFTRSSLVALVICIAAITLFSIKEYLSDRPIFGHNVVKPNGQLDLLPWLLIAPGMLSCLFFVTFTYLYSSTRNISMFVAFFIPFGASLVGTALLGSTLPAHYSATLDRRLAPHLMASLFIAAAWLLSQFSDTIALAIIGICGGVTMSNIFSVVTSRYFGALRSESIEQGGVACNVAFELGPALIVPIFVMCCERLSVDTAQAGGVDIIYLYAVFSGILVAATLPLLQRSPGISNTTTGHL